MQTLRQEYNDQSQSSKDMSNNSDMINNENDIRMIVSKVCHDLITPAGAVANGLELIESDSIPNPDIINLLEQSAKSLTAKLIMFRAFLGSNAAKVVSNADALIRTIKPYLDIYKISIEEADIKDDINNFHLKAITTAGLAIIAAEIIPFGGSIGLKFTENGCYLLLKGRTVDRKQEVINFLQSQNSKSEGDHNIEHNAKNILLIFLANFAKNNNIEIKITELGSNDLLFTF